MFLSKKEQKKKANAECNTNYRLKLKLVMETKIVHKSTEEKI